MDSDKFKSLAQKVKIPGSLVEVFYSQTSKGQHYALVINKVLWYALRLLLEVDERVGNCVLMQKLGEFFFLDSAKSKCREIQDRFSLRYPLLQIYFTSNKHQSSEYRIWTVVPDDARKNPDKYFRPGDQINISRKHLYRHEAVYLGNGRVIHVPNTKDPIREDSFSAFLGDNPLRIAYFNYLIRPKTQDEILSTAKSLIGTRGGDYSLILQNCQHFASFCVCGEELPTDLQFYWTPIYTLGKNSDNSFVDVRPIDRNYF